MKKRPKSYPTQSMPYWRASDERCQNHLHNLLDDQYVWPAGYRYSNPDMGNSGSILVDRIVHLHDARIFLVSYFQG